MSTKWCGRRDLNPHTRSRVLEPKTNHSHIRGHGNPINQQVTRPHADPPGVPTIKETIKEFSGSSAELPLLRGRA